MTAAAGGLYSCRGLVSRYHLIPSHFVLVDQSLMNISAQSRIVASRQRRITQQQQQQQQQQQASNIPASPGAARRRYSQNARSAANNEIKHQRRTSNLLPSTQTRLDERFFTQRYLL